MLKKNLIRPKNVSGNDTVETPFSLFDWSKRGTGRERQNSACHFRVKVGGVGWVTGAVGHLSVLEAGRLLLACPRGGNLSRGLNKARG